LDDLDGDETEEEEARFSRNNEHEEPLQEQQRNNYNPAYIFNIKKKRR